MYKKTENTLFGEMEMEFHLNTCIERGIDGKREHTLKLSWEDTAEEPASYQINAVGPIVSQIETAKSEFMHSRSIMEDNDLGPVLVEYGFKYEN